MRPAAASCLAIALALACLGQGASGQAAGTSPAAPAAGSPATAAAAAAQVKDLAGARKAAAAALARADFAAELSLLADSLQPADVGLVSFIRTPCLVVEMNCRTSPNIASDWSAIKCSSKKFSHYSRRGSLGETP